MWTLRDHECRPPERMPIPEKYEPEAISVGDIWRCPLCLRNNRVVEVVIHQPTKELILTYENCGY